MTHDPEAAERLAERLDRTPLRDMSDLPEEAAALIRAQAAEIEGLRGQITAIVDAYDRAMPLRTADWHGPECNCLRCEIDNARAALAPEPRA